MVSALASHQRTWKCTGVLRAKPCCPVVHRERHVVSISCGEESGGFGSAGQPSPGQIVMPGAATELAALHLSSSGEEFGFRHLWPKGFSRLPFG